MSGLFGGGAGKSEMKESNAIMRRNIERLEAIGVPSIEAQKIALTNPEFVDLLEAEALGQSAFADVQEDPRLRASALQALSGVEELAQQGIGAEDRAALNEIRRQAAGQAQAQRETVMQQMQERGLADSGASLIAQLTAGQQAADTMAQQGDRLAAQAAAARRQALGQQSDMAARMSQQQLSLAGQKASAADAISQFNTQNRQRVNEINRDYRVGMANQAAANRNQQEIFNKGLIQQDFQNQLSKATGVVGANNNLASNFQAQASAAQKAQQAQTGALINLGTTLGAAALKGGTSNLQAQQANSDTTLGAAALKKGT